ncbi:hypothetical protein [Bartonella doshiae]|uniref:hypothetical protein n=1 Tax=Bartonella doshiae TaxID=33044 RepID=UPI0015CF3EE7|nr:hypothetical protein [Bartonella doshiae]
MEQEKKKAVNMTVFYTSDFIYGVENEATNKEKIEKVFEPITLGVFTEIGALSFGFLTGSVMAIFSAIIGWVIDKTKAAKSNAT